MSTDKWYRLTSTQVGTAQLQDKWYRLRQVVPLNSDMDSHLSWVVTQAMFAQSQDPCDWLHGDHPGVSDSRMDFP